MENRYIFRGKRVDNGEWEFGDLLCTGAISETGAKTYSIVNGKCFDALSVYGAQEFWDAVEENEVIPETVGQFTGLKDKSGKMIFEGDILQWIDKDETYKGEMFWNKDAYGFRIQMPKGYMPTYKLLAEHTEIIGNIHENN